jgi:DNA-directed RNA polymerase subunit RPC12/RpoP
MFDAKLKEWKKKIVDGNCNEAKAFCQKYGLQFSIDLPQYRRNSNYRKTFFESRPGLFGRDFYFCTYCGKLLKKDNITVDHMFSVKAVQRSKFLKRSLKWFGIENINDSKNLVAACPRCNERKGIKGGLWVLRGLIGRYSAFWLVYWTIVLAVLIASLIFCIALLLNDFIYLRSLI